MTGRSSSRARVVDVDQRVVEVDRLDDDGRYDAPERLTGDSPVVVDAFPDVELTAFDILG